MNQDKGFYREEMKKTLDEARYDHTLGVAYTACALAMRHGVDIDKAYIAGMLHDCAKCLTHEERLRICEENDLPVSEVERENLSLLHAKVGAFIAKTRYGITDVDILNAIEYHTTGRPGMGILEKIVYLADFIEPNRRQLRRMDEIRHLAFWDLDEAILITTENILEYLQATGKTVDTTTIETHAYFRAAVLEARKEAKQQG